MTTRAQTVTILFTDLVGSTELLQRAGDDQAQRIFKAHHRLLREAVEANGGNEVKWLGDGLMVAFDSALDAVKCAIAMQQSSRRPTAGERLEIRAGLHVGEAFVDEADYFGTSVVIARRLCDRGHAGQILASDIVVRLLGGRGADIKANDLGPLELKGITNSVAAVEIVYEHDPMALMRKLPFVGRAAQFEAMMKKLAEAHGSRGSVILLAGEPGIGKTRLSDEFCEHASSGAMVIRGSCYEGEVGAPFGPWIGALRSLIEQTPDAELRDQLGLGAADVAVLMPEITSRLSGLLEAPRLDPEAERGRLFDSVGGFLRNAAAERPLVIFFDDLHWCDRPSLALFEQVARGIANHRIVIVGAYRDVEVGRAHPLAQTLAALRRMEHHERIAIRGFTLESVLDLLNTIEPAAEAADANRRLATVIQAEAEGNPFFIREVLSHLIETGKLAQRDGIWTGSATVEELGIPEGIKEVIGRRLSLLSEDCNRVLQRTSPMTSGFTWEELRAICDQSEHALLDALDEALGAQLLAELDRGTYAFTHALIRATLYEEMSTPRRVILHRQIGEALERLHEGTLDTHLSELAHHFSEAAPGGDVEKAISYARRAGDRATAQMAWEAAATNYERCLEAMELASGKLELDRIDVLLSLGQALSMAGADRERWRAVFKQAARLAREAGDYDRYGTAALGFATLIPTPGTLDGDVVHMLEEALEQAPAGTETPLRAMMLARLGNELSFSDQPERKKQLLSEALQMARRTDNPATLAQVLASLTWEGIDAVEALGLAREQLDAARRSGDRFAELRANNVLASRLLTLCDRDGFDQAVAEEERLQRELRIVDYWTGLHRALQQRLEGRFDEAERLAFQAFADLRYDDHENAAQGLGAAIFQIRIYQGRMLEMEDAVRANAERYAVIPSWRAALAAVYASDADRLNDARSTFGELAAKSFADLPGDALLPTTLCLLAEVCWNLGDAARASALYHMLLPFDGQCLVTGWANSSGGAVSRRLAILSATMKQWAQAELHFDDALRLEAQLDDRPSLAQTRAQYGEMLVMRGAAADRGRAAGLVHDAFAFAGESGMGKLKGDCARILELMD